MCTMILHLKKLMKNYRSHTHLHYLKVYLSKYGGKNNIYKKYVIGNIYRLPSYISDDVKSFINEFTALLNGLSIRSKSVYLCGVYNIDLLKINTVEDYSSFFDNVISSSFVPKITLPTRICDTGSSLIDNIYINTIDKDHICGIMIRPISDHQMYFSIMNENVTTTKSIQTYIQIEVCSQENMDRLNSKLQILICTIN